MDEVKLFLESHGVHPSSTMDNLMVRRKQIAYRLIVNDRNGCRIMLSSMLPYLRVKKVKAQDVLRYLALFPDARRYCSGPRIANRVAA
jgi:hypothetical protein